MKTIIVANRQRLFLDDKADVNKDGKVDTTEKLKKKYDQGVIPIKETTELGEVMHKAFEDVVSGDTRTSTVDMLGNISIDEEKNVLILAGMVSMRALPAECLKIVRLLLRYSISRDARGRDDMKAFVSGNIEKQSKINAGQAGRNIVGIK